MTQMKTRVVKIGEVKPNPDNPRLIKDDKFKKLVASIQSFPQMLEIRPIVVNDQMIVLGGNMRLKACKEAGLKTVTIIDASDLTEEQQREFVIKDNVGFGEWDWNDLANNWDPEQLMDWGLDIPDFKEIETPETDIDENKSQSLIKINFNDPEELQKAENDFQELIDRKYPNAIMSKSI